MAEAATFVTMQEDMKDAMRAKDSERLGAIRLLISSLKNKKIDLRRDLTEEDILEVLSTEAKKRREAAQAYRDGARQELADKEEFELTVIARYLPQPLSQDEVVALIVEAIASTGAASRKDMGKVMGVVMPQTKGRFDGAKIKDLVMAQLP